ncbi:MAG TPA: aldo/keto reductase [Pseudonocardia sp.]|nr:aldo/keto reductase [Pseudonocardia sp.]
MWPACPTSTAPCDAPTSPWSITAPLQVSLICRSSRWRWARWPDPAALAQVATELSATPAQVALAWLLMRSPWLLPIPGTSDPGHVEENVAAGALHLPEWARRRLNEAGRPV